MNTAAAGTVRLAAVPFSESVRQRMSKMRRIHK